MDLKSIEVKFKKFQRDKFMDNKSERELKKIWAEDYALLENLTLEFQTFSKNSYTREDSQNITLSDTFSQFFQYLRQENRQNFILELKK